MGGLNWANSLNKLDYVGGAGLLELVWLSNLGLTSLVAQTGKESVYNAADLGSIPGLVRSPGEGNGSPLQYSCLENPLDGGAW